MSDYKDNWVQYAVIQIYMVLASKFYASMSSSYLCI